MEQRALIELNVVRPDQIVIQDDPNFLPDFHIAGFDIDFSALDMSSASSSRKSSILSRQSLASSRSSQQGADISMPELLIPSPSAGSLGEIGGFQLPSERSTTIQQHERLGRLLDDDEAFNFDPGFTVDADGNLIEEPTRGSSDKFQLSRVGEASDFGLRVSDDIQGGPEKGQVSE